MFGFFSKRLSKNQAGFVALSLLEYIVEKDIDPREAVINLEPIFNHVADNSSYRDYKMTSEEIKIILRQSIYWLEHHSASVNKLHEFRITQRENRINNPDMHIHYRRDLREKLFKFTQDRPLLDSIKWKGK